MNTPDLPGSVPRRLLAGTLVAALVATALVLTLPTLPAHAATGCNPDDYDMSSVWTSSFEYVRTLVTVFPDGSHRARDEWRPYSLKVTCTLPFEFTIYRNGSAYKSCAADSSCSFEMNIPDHGKSADTWSVGTHATNDIWGPHKTPLTHGKWSVLMDPTTTTTTTPKPSPTTTAPKPSPTTTKPSSGPAPTTPTAPTHTVPTPGSTLHSDPTGEPSGELEAALHTPGVSLSVELAAQACANPVRLTSHVTLCASTVGQTRTLSFHLSPFLTYHLHLFWRLRPVI